MVLLRQTLDDAKARFPDHVQVIEALEAVARDTEDKNQWALLQDAYGRLVQGSGKYPAADYDAARSVLENAAHQTIRLHQYLSVLPAGRASQTIHSVIGLSFPKQYSIIKPTVLLLPDLDYYEFDLATFVSRDPIFPGFVPPPEMHGKVIRVSEPDAQSAISWSILAHEFGHAISAEGKLSANLDARTSGRFVKANPYLRQIIESYYEEFLADAIAAYATGPSSILALIRFELLLLPLTGYEPISTLSHPSTSARVALVRDLLGASIMDAFQGILNDYTELRHWVTGNRVNPNKKALDDWFEQTILPHLRQAAIQEVASLKFLLFSTDDLERSRRLANRLDRSIPPSAIRWTSKASIRKKLDEAMASGKPEEYRNCVRYLGERPATPGEILVAGYLHREATYSGLVEQTLLNWNRSATWQQNSQGISSTTRVHGLLAAAVETTNVHVGVTEAAREEGELMPLAALPEPAAGSTPVPPLPSSPVSLLSDIDVFQELIRTDADRLCITPLIDPDTQLGPSSLDVRLGTNALVITNVNIDGLDPMRPLAECRSQLSAYTDVLNISASEPLVLHPGEFALAATLEYVRMPRHLAGRLEGRSSYGRAGLLVHATAGFIDPGFEGTVTFELMNHGKVPIKLYPGARVGQLCFFPCNGQMRYSTKPEQKYQGALVTLASRFFEDKEYRWYREKRQKDLIKIKTASRPVGGKP